MTKFVIERIEYNNKQLPDLRIESDSYRYVDRFVEFYNSDGLGRTSKLTVAASDVRVIRTEE